MRGQAHTLEAIVASLILLTSIIFALQIAAVTPLSASTSSQHIQNQQQAVSQGVLSTAAEEDALKPAVLYWNNSTRQFHGANNEFYYQNDRPDNRFGDILNRALESRGIAYNVYLDYPSNANRVRYIYNGVPSDNSVVAGYTITLMDTDHLYNADGTKNKTTLGNGTTFVRGDIPDRGINVYNTVRVEVVTWRI